MRRLGDRWNKTMEDVPMAESGEAYEQPYIKLHIPEGGDIELAMIGACVYILEHSPMYPKSRPLTDLEKSRIAEYLYQRYTNGDPL